MLAFNKLTFNLAPLFHTVVQDFAFKVGENGQHALRSRDGLMTQVCEQAVERQRVIRSPAGSSR